MAQQSQPQYEFHYQRIELLKTKELGVGSYGAVYKAMCDDLPCAAKVLHRTLFQFTAPEATSVMQKFEQECRLLSAIKHPHIVQYLCTYHDPESRLPVLLMELMDESLTRFLERSHEPLSYHTEVNLCHDIALALSYLHSNGIVHRDLSSNNVLLIAGTRAKVTDFGMVKLYDVNHSTAHLTPLTLCPGTTVYMSPEALRDQPFYSDKLDSFSLGVLCVQIMTRQFPDPGDRFKIIEINDPRVPSGIVKVDIPEIERRQSHIDLIDPTHPLLPVAFNCLKDREQERPSCHELCGRMSTLKASPKYTESVQHSPVNTKPTQGVNRESRKREMQQSQQIQDLRQQLDALHDQLQGKKLEIQQQQQQIVGLQTLLTAKEGQLKTLQQHKEKQLADKDHQLQQKEASISAGQQEIQQLRQQLQSSEKNIQDQQRQLQEIQQLRQQLQSSEQVTAEFQQYLLDKEMTIRDQERQIHELQQQVKQRGSQRREEVEADGAAANGGSIELRWKNGRRAPHKMYGEVAAVEGSVAYFRPVGSNIVVAYNSTDNKWSELPECPNYSFSLAMVNSFLTAIGGMKPSHKVTNSLLSFTDEKWTKQFPPMPTKRKLTAVVCSDRSLVVAGGEGREDKKLRTVEVMNTEILQWSTARSLPHGLDIATATLCGNQIYLLGGFDQSAPSRLVFTCSLFALLQSSQPQSLGARLKTSSFARKPEVWHQLADTPVTSFTCTSLRGRLLAAGGCGSDHKETTAIHMYNPPTNSWEVISHMATPRLRCLVVVLGNELVVVGGGTPSVWATDSVEIATIV